MRSRYKTFVVHKRIMVNLVDGNAIDGVLWDERGDLIVLRDGNLHVAGASSPTPLDGETIVDRLRISFVQVA